MESMNITALPYDVLLTVFSHLDSYSLVNLSKCCLQFSQFFINSPLCKDLCFSNYYSHCECVNFEDIYKFSIANRNLITRLDLSYAHWLTYAQIKKLVAKLPHIQHINLIETSLSADQITQIINDNDTINSISMHYVRTIISKLKKRQFKRLHLVLSKYHSRHPLDVVSRLKVDEFKLTSYDLAIPSPIESFIDAEESTIEVVNYCDTRMHGTYMDHFMIDPVDHFICVECYNKIYLSEELLKDFSNYSNNIMKIENFIHYQCEDFINIFICKRNCSKRVENFMKKIRHRLSIRTKKRISLCSVKFCAVSENFNISDITPNLTMADHLLIPTCYLSHRVSRINTGHSDVAEVPKKTRRISRVSAAHDCAFNKITSANGNIKAILVKDDFELIRCCGGAGYPLNASLLKNLKHIKYFGIFSDSILSSTSFLSDVLKQCTNLTTLVMAGIKLHDSLFQNVTSTKCLSKSLKHFASHYITCRINQLVLNISKCPSLETIHVTFQSSPEELQLSTMKKLIVDCNNIRRIHIVEKSLLPTNMALMKRQKRIEKALRLSNPKIFIKLTEDHTIPLYPNQFYDMFRC